MFYFINIIILYSYIVGHNPVDTEQYRANNKHSLASAAHLAENLNQDVIREIGLEKSHFEIIAPDLYQFKDACNVYILKSGTSAILIDAGTGKVGEHLHEIGIEKIEWILHTNYHRDQSSGDWTLKEKGAKIAIGSLEADFLQSQEPKAPFDLPAKYLLNGELPDWGRRMVPFQRPGVDRRFSEGDEFRWNQYVMSVLNTPGHTEGSISYLLQINNKQYCFSGDLIISGGHIQDLYSMQWDYLRNPGIDSSITSLQKVNSFEVDVLLPSHGRIINNPADEIRLLQTRLHKVQRAFAIKRAGRWNWSGFVQVSPHVIQDCGSTSQIIISKSGEALLFDCGKELTTERLEEAKKKFGFEKISVIIPSHWHYDHVDGISSMVESEDAGLWVWEGLAEHLEKPKHFITTCWTGKSIQPDRILFEGESFQWHEYSFKVYHHPVHMEQQMALKADIDGITFYLVADGTGLSKEGNIRCPIHCYNGITLSSGLLKTATSFFEADPYICLPAHSNVFATNNNDKVEFVQWATETTDALTSLLPMPYPEFGYEPYWITFYPARVILKKGEETQVMIRIKNPAKASISGNIWPKFYGELNIEEAPIEFMLQPGEQKDFPLKIKVNKDAQAGINIITADVELNEKLMAEFPQGYIQIDE